MAEKEKKPIQILRDRHGGMSDELKGYFKNQNQLRKKISGALKSGPKTVPEISKEIGEESSAVMWQLMAMKRYGDVYESGRSGRYFQYTLKEASQ
jgi:predicted transcriptional regulator